MELGDIRYNVLNLISPDDFVRFHPLAGFGPLIADFETGEVISATSNLYLDQMHTFILRDIYHYIQSYSGLTLPFRDRLSIRTINDSSSVKEEFKRYGGDIFVPRFLYSWNPSARGYDLEFKSGGMDQVPFFGLTLSGTENGRETVKLFSENPFPDKNKDDEGLSPNGPATSFSGAPLNSPHCSLQSQGFLPSRLRYHLIDALCGERLALLKEIQNDPSITEKSPHIKRHWLYLKSAEEQNKKDIFLCADKVLKVSALGLGVHEMGHNMSLRHNFAASADKNNFLPVNSFRYNHTFENEKEKQKVLSLFPEGGVTASVMDYLPSFAEIIIPGRYDIAFIRFLHTGELETRDKGFAKTEMTEEGELLYVSSKEGNIIHPRNLRDYKVCTDGDLKTGGDIYCDMFDRGVTPSEITQNHFNYLFDGLNLDGNALSSNIHATKYHLQMFFHKTKKIYHRWRIQLSKALREGDTLTLRNFGAKDYREQISNLICEEGASPAPGGTEICANGAVKNPELADLYKARTIIYDTLRKMLFSTRDHYCVLRNMDKDDLDEWVPFSDIHRHLSETSRPDLKVNFKEISSCNDVKNLFPRNVRRYIGETGIPFLPGVFSLRQNRDFDFYKILNGTQADYTGSALARLLAGVLLIAHSRSPVLGQRDALSLMNEPDIREEIFQLLTDRILKGIPIGHIMETNRPVFQPVFSNEEALWRFLSLPLFLSHSHPTTALDRIENLTDSLAVVRPIQLSHPNFIDPGSRNLVQKERALEYDRIRRAGGYLANENKELYHRYSEGSALALINKTRSPHLTSLIGAVRAVDLRKSFLKFTEKINQSDRDTFFENKKTKMLTYLKDLIRSARRLYSDPSPFFTVLAFSLLYDFLEAGEPDEAFSHLIRPEPNHGALTDLLVQQLQTGRVLHFQVEEGFQKECAKTGRKICPEPYLIEQKRAGAEELMDFKKFDNIVQGFLKNKKWTLDDFIDTAFFQGREIKTINIFKPTLQDLIQRISSTDFEDPAEGDPASSAEIKKRKVFELVQDLYLMELFRSDHHANSEVHRSLTSLLQDLQARNFVLEEDQKKGAARKERIIQDITILRTLRNHPNSKFFQEIFIRNTLFYSLTEKSNARPVSAIIAILEAVLNPIGLTVPSTAVDFLTFIDIQNEREEAVFQSILKRSSLTARMYHTIFLDKISLEIIQNFQNRAAEILTNSIQETMQTMRGFPPVFNNPVKGLEHFFSAAYYDESAPLYDIFNGRAFKELTSQKNIILSAISPYLILERGIESAGAGGGE